MNSVPTVFFDHPTLDAELKDVILDLHNGREEQKQVDINSIFEHSYWEVFRAKIIDQIKTHQYVVIKGIPFDNSNTIYISFAHKVGNPIVTYTHQKEKIVRDVSPLKGKVLDPSLAHTDSTFWPEPNDLTALMCVKKDDEGNGKSRIVSIDRIQELLPEGEVMIDRLFNTNYPFALDPRFGESGFQMLPILTREERFGETSTIVRYNLSDTMSCLNKFEVTLSEEELNDLKTFEKTASKIASESEFLLEKGDILIFDNKRSLHSRTPCLPNSDRIFRMMKINFT